MNILNEAFDVAVVGGGPAGLMAAEAALAGGARVAVFDAMPSVGRKFLLAGKGGLNLTHSEPLPAFIQRYEEAAGRLSPLLEACSPQHLREFAGSFGIDTFVGSSGRVFPGDMKAAPLLRRWLARLRARGVVFHMRHRWLGWEDDALCFEHAGQRLHIKAPATVLALGGGSWPQLGSDGQWVAALSGAGVAVTPLVPANCGFECAWSPFFIEHFAGAPLKAVAAQVLGDASGSRAKRGEFVVTAAGVEGSLIYALSSRLRRTLAAEGAATLLLDLLPDTEPVALARALGIQAGKRSVAEQLRRGAGISGVKAALLREVLPKTTLANPALLAQALKALPLRLTATRPLAEAISTAGGVALAEVDEVLMLKQRPGVFCAGEMLDWEAPTGGYLLSACFATGARAGDAAAAWATRPLETPKKPARKRTRKTA